MCSHRLREMAWDHRLVFGDFQFDPATGDLYRTSQVVPVTPRALAVLGYLLSRPDRLVTKRDLLDTLWADAFVTDGVLKVCVHELRRALGDQANAPRFIETAHRRGYRFIAPVRKVCVRVEERRSVADGLPAARVVEPPGDDDLPLAGDADGDLAEIERFVREVRLRSAGRRMLAAILCATPGPHRTIAPHRQAVTLEMLVRTEAAGAGGGSIERSGDRVFAIFDAPARAIRCGRALGAAATRLGLPLRIGVHAGECDLVDGVAQGLAASISERIARLARTGEVLVSRTMVDLVAGSGLGFSDRGAHRLADGFHDWQVFAVAHDTGGDQMVAAPPPGSSDRALARLA